MADLATVQRKGLSTCRAIKGASPAEPGVGDGLMRNEKEFDKWREKEGTLKWKAAQVHAQAQK